MSKSFIHSLMLLTFLVAACVTIASDSAKSSSENGYIEFPATEALRKSFQEAGLGEFFETEIEGMLEDQLIPFVVALRLEDMFDNYNKYMQQGEQNGQQADITKVKTRKSQIFEFLLQKDPAALEELRVRGLYEPTKQDRKNIISD